MRHDLAHVQSTEDIAYLSGESLYSSKAQSKEAITRSGSISSTRPRSLRVTRSTTVPKTTTASNESTINENVTIIDKSSASAVCEKSDSSSEGEFVDTIEPQNVKSYTVAGNSFKEPLYKSNSVDSIHSVTNANILHVTKRSGKYNKRAAPLPPMPTTKDVKKQEVPENIPAIKATLVLTPSVISKSSNQNICPNSKNQSPSCKSLKNKQLGRFMMLPKKMNFWHKGVTAPHKNAVPEKRSSWYAELSKTAHLSLMELKPLSKSADNFYVIQKPASSNFKEDADSD